MGIILRSDKTCANAGCRPGTDLDIISSERLQPDLSEISARGQTRAVGEQTGKWSSPRCHRGSGLQAAPGNKTTDSGLLKRPTSFPASSCSLPRWQILQPPGRREWKARRAPGYIGRL